MTGSTPTLPTTLTTSSAVVLNVGDNASGRSSGLQVNDIVGLVKCGVNGGTPTWRTLVVTEAGSSLVARTGDLDGSAFHEDGAIVFELERAATPTRTTIKRGTTSYPVEVTGIEIHLDGSLNT